MQFILDNWSWLRFMGLFLFVCGMCGVLSYGDRSVKYSIVSLTLVIVGLFLNIAPLLWS